MVSIRFKMLSEELFKNENKPHTSWWNIFRFTENLKCNDIFFFFCFQSSVCFSDNLNELNFLCYSHTAPRGHTHVSFYLTLYLYNKNRRQNNVHDIFFK